MFANTFTQTHSTGVILTAKSGIQAKSDKDGGVKAFIKMETKKSPGKPRSRSQSGSRVSTTGRAGQIEDEDEKSIKEAQNHFNPTWSLGLPLDDITSLINNVEGHER